MAHNGESKPRIYVIAGPNGAGKTTFAREFLPHYADCRQFINADLIAQGMSPFSPDAAAFRAGRLMLEEIERHAGLKETFGFETTLSGLGHLRLLRRLKKSGYEVHFFFLWVPTVSLALTRVRDRVLRGGHNVPEIVVRRRFERSIRNFLLRYRPLSDSWMLFDNAGTTPVVVAFQKEANPHIMNRELYENLLFRYDIMTKPPTNVLNLPLEERAEMALKAAVENVILESAREGRPIYIWRIDARVAASVEEL